MGRGIAGDGSSQIAGVAFKEREIGESLERKAEMTKTKVSRVFIFNDSNRHVSVGISSESLIYIPISGSLYFSRGLFFPGNLIFRRISDGISNVVGISSDIKSIRKSSVFSDGLLLSFFLRNSDDVVFRG